MFICDCPLLSLLLSRAFSCLASYNHRCVHFSLFRKLRQDIQQMDSPPIQEETEWNSHMLQPLEHVATRSQSPNSESPDPRRPSAEGSDRLGSVSTGTGEAGTSRGRRSRPSVTAASSQLTSVRELKARKGHLSSVSTVVNGSGRDRPSVVSKTESEENVVSTKQVRHAM